MTSAHLRIACYGYVEREAGSVASANYFVLGELLARGHEIDFYAIRDWIEPRDLSAHRNFRYLGHVIPLARWYERKAPLLARRATGPLVRHLFLCAYLRRIAGDLRRRHALDPYDVVMFLGVPPQFEPPPAPIVAWRQGAPGTELEAIRGNRRRIIELCGRWHYALLEGYYLSRGIFQRRRDLACPTVHVCGSPWTAGRLVALGVTEERARGIPYPIDLQAFSPGDFRARGADEPVQILWLGRVTPRKRLDLLVEAFLLLLGRRRDVHLRVFGRVPYARGYLSLLDALPRDTFTYATHVDRSEVPALLRDTDVLVQPSENEDFGSSVAEALACGAAVVLGPTNGTGAFVGDAGFRFDTYTPESVCAALVRAVDAVRQRGADLRRRARAVAEREFSSANVVDALERCLHDARHYYRSDAGGEGAAARPPRVRE